MILIVNKGYRKKDKSFKYYTQMYTSRGIILRELSETLAYALVNKWAIDKLTGTK